MQAEDKVRDKKDDRKEKRLQDRYDVAGQSRLETLTSAHLAFQVSFP